MIYPGDTVFSCYKLRASWNNYLTTHFLYGSYYEIGSAFLCISHSCFEKESDDVFYVFIAPDGKIVKRYSDNVFTLE